MWSQIRPDPFFLELNYPILNHLKITVAFQSLGAQSKKERSHMQQLISFFMPMFFDACSGVTVRC
jgi:hypothetical protein